MLNQLVESIIEAYQDSSASTPWGKADTQYPIERGVVWYGTPSHGGLMVAKSIAMKKLSAHARELGEFWGGKYWYEEDVAWNIPFYENPDWMKKHSIDSGAKEASKGDMENTIKRYWPEYFEDEFRAKSIKREQKPILQVGDILHGKGMGHDKYTVARIDGTGRSEKVIVQTDEGKVYRMPEGHIKKYVVKIERSGKEIWNKD